MTSRRLPLDAPDETVPAFRIEGRVTAVMAARTEGSFVTADEGVLELGLDGIAGDRHGGATRPADSRTPWYPRGLALRNSRQVSIVSPEENAEIARRLGVDRVEPEWLGANLVIDGVPDLTRLPPGTRLFFPGPATLVVEGENNPCRFAGRSVGVHFPGRDDIELAFPKVAKGLRGVVAWVERAGPVRNGDTVDVKIAAQRLYRG